MKSTCSILDWGDGRNEWGKSYEFKLNHCRIKLNVLSVFHPKSDDTIFFCSMRTEIFVCAVDK